MALTIEWFHLVGVDFWANCDDICTMVFGCWHGAVGCIGLLGDGCNSSNGMGWLLCPSLNWCAKGVPTLGNLVSVVLGVTCLTSQSLVGTCTSKQPSFSVGPQGLWPDCSARWDMDSFCMVSSSSLPMYTETLGAKLTRRHNELRCLDIWTNWGLRPLVTCGKSSWSSCAICTARWKAKSCAVHGSLKSHSWVTECSHGMGSTPWDGVFRRWMCSLAWRTTLVPALAGQWAILWAVFTRPLQKTVSLEWSLRLPLL